MFPRTFDYVAPDSLEEVLSTLGEHGEDAKVLAGGQSLIPLMKLRFASPALLVDVNRVPGLAGIEETGGGLRIGALTRHAEVERATSSLARYPTIAAAARLVADPLVRNLGTVGGSLAHADPAGDWASVMSALSAEVVARGSDGERTIPVRELFVSLFTTTLEPTDVLTEIRVPNPRGAVGGDYLKLERKVGDFATVAVAVSVEMRDGRIGRAGIALTAVGPRTIVATEAEQVLEGAEPTAEVYREAAERAAAAADPVSDVRGSAEYKRAVVREYVRRGLATSVARAGAA